METYNGHVRTPADAIILFEACRIGLLPRVQRRLSEKERQSIKSGSVFVWDEREAGMRRWTDGKSWSASRVSGSFLTYREMEGKRGGSSFDKTASREAPQPSNEQDSDGGPDGYRYKPDGLMKQSFSITTNNSQHLHLISYYSRSSQQSQHLMQPTNDPQLRHIRPEKGMYPESTVHEQSTIPAVTRGPMGSPGYTHAAHQAPMYGRPGYGYPPHPGAWAPPSPMHTPPPHPHYGPYYQHPGHPGYPPPMGYSHYPPYGPSAYDRPPHMAGHGLPPPPPHYGHGPPPPSSLQAAAAAAAAAGYPPSHAPPYQGYGSYPPPPPSVSASIPPPATTPGATASAPPLPKPDARPIPPPVSIPEPKKDERQDSHQSQLKSPARSTPEAQSQSGAQAQATQSTGPPSVSSASAAAAPAASSGQTIPSIHAMLNAGENGQPPVRSSSRSPTGGSRMASDIPMHKLGFEASRDVQALRNLDKTTFKAY
ncbi:hypothetical protein Q7P37_006168 [Cladosporium fusiforme]